MTGKIIIPIRFFGEFGWFEGGSMQRIEVKKTMSVQSAVVCVVYKSVFSIRGSASNHVVSGIQLRGVY